MHLPIQLSAARESKSVLFVENWFRRLRAHASQAPLLRTALDKLGTYKHPWLGNQDLQQWGVAQHGSDWAFDAMTHHTSEILSDVRAQDPGLAATLQELWAGDENLGTAHSSYRNRARELARICGESLDHTPGSVDMTLVERADSEDGFQILQLMREATILVADESMTADFVDQDKELNKIRHKFVASGVHTYMVAYKRQLRLFVEMDLPFKLPEQYNCQRIIAHLATRCMEFKKCAQSFADLVRDKRAKYTYAAVEREFTQCEKRHALGPDNRGTPVPGQVVSPTATAMMAGYQPPVAGPRGPKKRKRSQSPKRGTFPKGSCIIHPESTTHDTKTCYIAKKRREFVHPTTGKKGLTQAEICPKHPHGWHPADLCGDPRFFNWSRKNRQNNINAMANLMQTQKQQVQVLRQQIQQVQPTAPIVISTQSPVATAPQQFVHMAAMQPTSAHQLQHQQFSTMRQLPLGMNYSAVHVPLQQPQMQQPHMQQPQM